jgi:peptide deformylase
MSTIDGEIDTATFEGFTARVFQHEYDHMEGYDFRRRANRYHLDKAMKDLRLLQRRRKQRAA